jgi:hypothetical protein
MSGGQFDEDEIGLLGKIDVLESKEDTVFNVLVTSG